MCVRGSCERGRGKARPHGCDHAATRGPPHGGEVVQNLREGGSERDQDEAPYGGPDHRGAVEARRDRGAVLLSAIRAEVEGAEDTVLEAMEEHHVAKWVLSELDGMDPTHERFDAKVQVLIENVRHHVQEEEQELFPRFGPPSDARGCGSSVTRWPSRRRSLPPDRIPGRRHTAGEPRRRAGRGHRRQGDPGRQERDQGRGRRQELGAPGSPRDTHCTTNLPFMPGCSVQ